LKKIYSLLAIAFTACAAHAQVDANRTVAVVNGDEIKGGEYYHRMEYLSGVGRISNNGVAEFPPGFLTIEQLISERLILQLAKNKGVLPTDVEVENELKNRVTDNPKLLENWLNSGQSEADLRYLLKLEIAQFKVATAGITVTDQEVEQFYKEHPTMYTTPKKVKISVIVVRDDTAQKAVDDDLKAGKSFADTAKAHSADVTKGLGGELGSIFVTALNPSVQAAIEKIKIGQTTEWLVTNDARVKFLLEDATPAKKMEFTPSLKRDIRKRMMIDKGQVKNDVAKEMLALRSTAKIDIKDKVFAEAYSKYIEAYKKDAALKAGGGN